MGREPQKGRAPDFEQFGEGASSERPDQSGRALPKGDLLPFLKKGSSKIETTVHVSGLQLGAPLTYE